MSSLTPVELCVALPWPDRRLSPNARVHWSRRAKAVKLARQEALALAFEAGARRLRITGQPRIAMTFCPPDRRRRDMDNLIASMKAANDGIADALNVDDSRFVSTYSMGAPVKGGAVLVTVRVA